MSKEEGLGGLILRISMIKYVNFERGFPVVIPLAIKKRLSDGLQTFALFALVAGYPGKSQSSTSAGGCCGGDA